MIAYQLCQRENKASYTALLSRIPAPIVVVTNGDKGALAAFHQLYDQWLEDKTYRSDVSASDIPAFARNNKKWWYTHYETRGIIKSLDTYVKSGVLFTFLAPDLDVSNTLASTTNQLEGGINSPLKAFLHAHRGWSEHRMLTTINYWLYSRNINPEPLQTFINNTIAQPQTQPVQKEQTGPVEIDTHINTHILTLSPPLCFSGWFLMA